MIRVLICTPVSGCGVFSPALTGKPAILEKALGKLWISLDEGSQARVRREVYAKFFALAPKGQDYFKQSTTRHTL